MAPENSKLFEWHFTELNSSEVDLCWRRLLLFAVFCSVILLITSVFLYARRFCCRRRLSSSASASNSSSRSHANAPPTRQIGLDAAAIASLPIILHRSLAAADIMGNNGGVVEEAECCICLSLFEEDEKLKVLPECHHAYHSVCVDKWLSTQSSCPLCRASLSAVYELTIPIDP